MSDSWNGGWWRRLRISFVLPVAVLQLELLVCSFNFLLVHLMPAKAIVDNLGEVRAGEKRSFLSPAVPP